jgi:hypothetical protein
VVREIKLAAFVLLLVAVFVCAHLAGSRLGPVSTDHSRVSYTGTTGTGGGMKMGAPAARPVRAATPRGARP